MTDIKIYSLEELVYELRKAGIDFHRWGENHNGLRVSFLLEELKRRDSILVRDDDARLIREVWSCQLDIWNDLDVALTHLCALKERGFNELGVVEGGKLKPDVSKNQRALEILLENYPNLQSYPRDIFEFASVDFEETDGGPYPGLTTRLRRYSFEANVSSANICLGRAMEHRELNASLRS